jgi:hypothetical protein
MLCPLKCFKRNDGLSLFAYFLLKAKIFRLIDTSISLEDPKTKEIKVPNLRQTYRYLESAVQHDRPEQADCSP